MEKKTERDMPIELRMKLSEGGQLFYLQYKPKENYTVTDRRFFGLIKRVLVKSHPWRYVTKYENIFKISAYEHMSDPNRHGNWKDVWYHADGIEETLDNLKKKIHTYGDLADFFDLDNCQRKYEADLEKWKEEMKEAHKRGSYIY